MMKKRKNVVLVALLGTMMSIGFAGCGEKEDTITTEVLADVGSMVSIESEETEESVETDSDAEETVTESEEMAEFTEETVVETAEAEIKTEENREVEEEAETERTKESVKETEEKPKTDKTETPAPTQTQATENKSSATLEVTQPQTSTPAPTPTPEAAPTPTPAPEAQKPAEHVHSFVEEVTEATCDMGKVITTKCSSCGHVEGTRTEGNGLGHDYTAESWLYPATCTGPGYKVVECTRCKKDGPGTGDVPMLPHTYETKVKAEGDCRSPKITQDICTVCGHEEPSVWDYEAHANDHVWISGTIQVWSDEAFAMVDVERTCCEVCGAEPE